MVPSTWWCSRFWFIPNGHETQIPCRDKLSGPLRSPDGSSDGGFGVSCPFSIHTYLEHPPVQAPFWDILNNLKYFGLSKGEFIHRKFLFKIQTESYGGWWGLFADDLHIQVVWFQIFKISEGTCPSSASICPDPLSHHPPSADDGGCWDCGI